MSLKLPQGLLFLKDKHFWNFETCPFSRNCTFAHIWSEYRSNKLHEASKRQAWQPWIARCVLEGKSDKFICVFLSKVSDRPISPQSGEGDMHEVPRLRTKVVRWIREFSRWGPRPLIARPSEPLQINLFGESQRLFLSFKEWHDISSELWPDPDVDFAFWKGPRRRIWTLLLWDTALLELQNMPNVWIWHK